MITTTTTSPATAVSASPGCPAWAAPSDTVANAHITAAAFERIGDQTVTAMTEALERLPRH